ncbi:MAG: glutathione binding-like protein [Archangium sp.]
MKLYASPLACSAAVQMVLFELGIPHEVEFVDIYAQPHVLIESRAVYSALNAKDAVPALELDSGELLTEVGVILQFLGDKSAESPLLPRFGTLARYRVMEWLSYIGSDFHKTIGPLFNPKMPEDGKALHRQKLERVMRYFESRLSTNDYLTGPDFTVADAYLFVMMGWPPYFKVDLGPFPNLQRYHARIAERPSFLRVKELIAPILERVKVPVFPSGPLPDPLPCGGEGGVQRDSSQFVPTRCQR